MVVMAAMVARQQEMTPKGLQLVVKAAKVFPAQDQMKDPVHDGTTMDTGTGTGTVVDVRKRRES